MLKVFNSPTVMYSTGETRSWISLNSSAKKLDTPPLKENKSFLFLFLFLFLFFHTMSLNIRQSLESRNKPPNRSSHQCLFRIHEVLIACSRSPEKDLDTPCSPSLISFRRGMPALIGKRVVIFIHIHAMTL